MTFRYVFILCTLCKELTKLKAVHYDIHNTQFDDAESTTQNMVNATDKKRK
jgi:hypothetical protein